jgi:hypothetical protein
MTPGYTGPTYRQSLSTEKPPVVARVNVDYDSDAERYSVRFEEVLPGSTVASAPWSPKDNLRRDTRDLPGQYGESGCYELTLLLGAESRAPSDATDVSVAPFAPESSAALEVRWTPLHVADR